jgi:SAM-dependent methyltransferase
MHAESRLTHNWLAKKLINDRIGAYLDHMRGTVVDLGCGKRPYEQDILHHAERYIGIDWSNTLHGLQADIIADVGRPLPIRDACADTVVSFEVLEHVAEPTVMLAQAYRVLRPGGGLFLSVPFQWWVHEAPWDFYRYTRYGLEYLLTKAGFIDITVQATSGFWSMWILKLNYQLARLPRGPRPAQKLIRATLIPFWWLGQILAPVADRYWSEDHETVGYFVTARKP